MIRRPVSPLRTLPLLALVAVLPAACGSGADAPPAEAAPDTQAAAEVAVVHPHDAFFENLAALCGRAFRGEATLSSSTDFEGEMIMHVRQCTEDTLHIPLHVGENRSRTWIVTRTAEGLRLKHDHRHEDGSEDDLTQYGGDTTDPGTPLRQAFPADAYTAELLPEAATNVWTMELEPGERFTYHLTRHGEDRATFVIDLTDEVPPPPAPWGYEELD
jgi:hypothetical protein